MSFCTFCGKELISDENYCPKCGKKVRKIDTEEEQYQNYTDEQDSDEPQYITFYDDDGRKLLFEYLDMIIYRRVPYVVLLPPGDNEVGIAQVIDHGQGTYEYRPVSDETLARRIFTLYKVMHPENDYID